MLKAGVGKDDILAETKHVVGVNDVSFNVKEGEVFVVMGLSGSGKSTLIRCLNRLYEPTSGQVFVDGEDVVQADKDRLQEIRRTKMAMVFQHFGLFPHKTVGYNVAYGLQVRGMGNDEARQKSLEALEMVGLKEWIDHYPDNLSGGMQQRVGLARALATDADILLMDEAFSALDPLIRRQMQDEMMRLQERLHKTIIFITHDLNEALRVGNHVAIMRDGSVVQIGSPTDIITSPADDYVAKFMSDVDQSRVLSAEFAMQPAHRLVLKKHDIQGAMRRMDDLNVSALYVVGEEDEQPEGLVWYQHLRRLSAKGVKDLRQAVSSDFPTTARFTPLTDLYPLYDEGMPVAVVGDSGRLLGVVYPRDILNALATTEEAALSPAQEEVLATAI
jgi:glycine betaine/proline transport system ATP-binding protein